MIRSGRQFFLARPSRRIRVTLPAPIQAIFVVVTLSQMFQNYLNIHIYIGNSVISEIYGGVSYQNKDNSSLAS
jgi:hypothetical protein